MYSNKLHDGGDFFFVTHFCSLLYPQRVWNNAGTQKDSINICWVSKWNIYCLQSHLQRIKTLISIMLSLFKLFYGRNFSLGISFETTSIFLQSHFNFWIKSIHSERVYLRYLSGMDPNNFLTLFSKGEFTILEVIKRTPQVLKAILWEAYQNVCINKTSLEKVSNFLRWIPWRE